ncbi:Phosphoglucosamine mutase [Zhongshania aliphaticivorans]|uniref:Phosphoglucosamine mutase n=1 Tax=Zhongshania aliphaticivorans TaxID=1470434 RepID=A0A5S9MZB6_9GAMM|nr:phosphoglucosamine mutase [Zhongshania aliphaticivorans]CAA0081614.1 Phosphoglucosamine mutase [Zhongshania aliphaticivorans]CAA0084890.1 Phosphoglucosamine mutase [Zhongshania aliphaticivorans]
MTRKYFGTDGVRGRVGEGAITPEFVLKLGWAVGQVFAREGRSKVLIGKDTRISGYMFESALEAGLVAAGVDVLLLGPMPTPAIAYLTRTFQARAGIVISASHNPYYDNGIKFFSADGTKLPDELELAIEEAIDVSMTTVESAQLGKVRRIDDAAGRYIEYCKSTAQTGLSLAGLKIVLDCANGATYHVAPAVFAELGAEVIVMGVSPDGLNINANVGSTHPTELQSRVVQECADFGIAFDGDGDRVLFADASGDLVDGDEILYIIAAERLRRGKECSGVVGTLMSNLGFELALKALGIAFERANVGDRYVKERMNELDWQLGGENSGHIICGDVSTTGDGVVAALKVVQAVVGSGKSLHELRRPVSKFPQIMQNIRIQKPMDLNHAELRAEVDQVELELAGRGRVLLRASGTEPLVRVMVEGENAAQVADLCQRLAGKVQKLSS